MTLLRNISDGTSETGDIVESLARGLLNLDTDNKEK